MKEKPRAPARSGTSVQACPMGERGHEGVQRCVKVFLVLIKCLALSTPGSMSCEGRAEMGKKLRKIWPWGFKEAAGTHFHGGLVALDYFGGEKQCC